MESRVVSAVRDRSRPVDYLLFELTLTNSEAKKASSVLATVRRAGIVFGWRSSMHGGGDQQQADC
jgi:hypothetical protein